MTSQRWEKIKALFEAASEIDAEKRAEFLDQACGSDKKLRTEVEDFFVSLESIEGFLEEPAINEIAGLIVGKSEKLAKGRRIVHYEILRQLGAGGMGEVYLAEDTRLHRRIALKILPANLTADRSSLERFKQEARAASALNHPNIVTIHEVGEAEGVNFMATEFVEGETLREKMNGNLPATEAFDALIQIASALSVAHSSGVIHRDIKPENVMVRPDGLIKLLDFGLAKLLESSGGFNAQQSADKMPIQTQAGMILGTVNYMSPEQARGAKVDQRTDLWSLGVCFYEMLSGKTPFSGKTINHTLVAIMEDEPAPPTNLSAKTAKIILKLLAKKPEDRYQSANDLLVDLKEQKKVFTSGSVHTKIYSAGDLLENAARAKQSFLDSSAPNNLSAVRTKLIGREKETAEIAALLCREDVRLLTLTGIGGTGKTSLAKAVAFELLSEFRDGVFFVDLSAVHDSALVLSTVAQMLGIKESGGRPLAGILKDFLSARETLLVLDNFEQVIDAAIDLAALLASAPDLKILATSRALLRLSIEREFIVTPLDLPDENEDLTAGNLQNYAAIALFVARARIIKPNFDLTDENALAVVKICRRLDGLPLAIELAAARVKLMSPPTILARLESQLQILTGGARDLPARQQTMRGAIAWSYDLLDEAEKRLFERLSVFAGGFTLEAAESVVGEIAPTAQKVSGNNETTVSVFDGIASLIDKNLLITKEQTNGEIRFRTLEAVGEFARERLQISGESELIKGQHSEYFLALGEKAEPELLGASQAEWTNLLEAEHDNLRDALARLIVQDAEKALRLASAIRNFWAYHGHLTEGRKWMEAVLAGTQNTVNHSAHGKLLNSIGGIARQQGDYQSARKFYEQTLIAAETSADKKLIAQANRGLGAVAYLQNDYAVASLFFEKGLAISRELNDEIVIAISLNALGELARAQNDYASARPLYEETLALSRKLGNKEGILNNLNNLGAVFLLENDVEGANSHYVEALAMAREMGHKAGISYSLDGFAAIAAQGEDLERAIKLAAAAENLRQSIGCQIETTDRLFREIYLSDLRGATSEKDFAALYGQGRKLKLAEAIALALSQKIPAE